MPPKSFKVCGTIPGYTGETCDRKLYKTLAECKKEAGNTTYTNPVCKEGGGRGNRWVNHVKAYAQQHGMKYGDALRDSHCQASYRRQ